MDMIRLYEITAWDRETGAEVTLRFCEDPRGYQTRVDDPDLPRTPFAPDIKTGFKYTDSLSDHEGVIGGRGDLNIGTIVLRNTSGRYDEYPDRYAFGDRQITVLRGPRNGRYADFTPEFNGFITHVSANADHASVTIKSWWRKLDVDFLAERYLGDNDPGSTTGVEGDENIRDQFKPEIWGKKFGCRGVLVNQLANIYQVSIGPIKSVPMAYDKGVEITFEAIPGGETFDSFAPTPGFYTVDTSRGLVKFGSKPVGEVTFDVEGRVFNSGTVFPVSHAEVTRWMISEKAGVEFVDGPAFDAWHAADTYEIGVQIDQETTLETVIGDLLNSGGATFRPSLNGVFTPALFEGLTGDVDHEIAEHQIKGKFGRNRVFAARYGFQTAYRVVGPNIPTGTAGTGGGSQSEFQKAKGETVSVDPNAAPGFELQMANNPRSAIVQDLGIQTVELDAKLEQIPGALYDTSTGAQARGARGLAIYRYPRAEWRTNFDSRCRNIFPGHLIRITYPRHGCSSGRLFRVLSIEKKPGDRWPVTLWG